MKTRRIRVKTFKQAYGFVLNVKTCLIFGSKESTLPSLWDAVDLPERKAGEKGWGPKFVPHRRGTLHARDLLERDCAAVDWNQTAQVRR